MEGSGYRREAILDFWEKTYSLLIPILSIITIALINCWQDFHITSLCGNAQFGNMLTALISSISIVISVFGFLIPSLVSAKNEKMVKYFMENANMNLFVKKVSGIVRSGLIGIGLSMLLFLNENLLQPVLTAIIYIWIGVILNFACNSYRFIGIIIALLMVENKDKQKRRINPLSNERVGRLNSKLKKF